MQMHQLHNPLRKHRKRVGRGGKYQKTCGRGTKGQKARAGGNVDPLFEGGRSSLIQRMKKQRGFRSPHPSRCTVTLAALERAFADGETVTIATLVARGVLRAAHARRGAKVVATGTLTKKLTLGEDVDASAAAARAFVQPAASSSDSASSDNA